MQKAIRILPTAPTKHLLEKDQHAQEIIAQIHLRTLEIIQNSPHKIKTVKGYKYHHKTIYEYKLTLTHCSYRVAYSFIDEYVEVFFISTILLKAQFTKLISTLPEVSKG